MGAYAIDSLIAVGLGVTFGAPFLGEVLAAVGDYWSASMDAARTGASPPPQSSMRLGHEAAFLAYTLIWFTSGVVYQAVCLRFRSATFGMSALGIALRRRGEPGRLPWSTALTRVGVQFGPMLLGFFPYAGAVPALYLLVDDLWPLWDRRRQALHDKAADTVVVRTR